MKEEYTGHNPVAADAGWSGPSRPEPGWRPACLRPPETELRRRTSVPACAAKLWQTGVMPAYERISVDPRQMGGVPCIRRLRIPVATVVGMVADGMGPDEILAAYPDLEREDVAESLRYAAEAVRERELPLRTVA